MYTLESQLSDYLRERTFGLHIPFITVLHVFNTKTYFTKKERKITVGKIHFHFFLQMTISCYCQNNHKSPNCHPHNHMYSIHIHTLTQ